MSTKTVRYTATLPFAYVCELKELAKEEKIPSVNYAINEAIDEYLKEKKASQYKTLLKEAGQDKAFLARTMSNADDFSVVDSEVSGEW